MCWLGVWLRTAVLCAAVLCHALYCAAALYYTLYCAPALSYSGPCSAMLCCAVLSHARPSQARSFHAVLFSLCDLTALGRLACASSTHIQLLGYMYHSLAACWVCACISKRKYCAVTVLYHCLTLGRKAWHNCRQSQRQSRRRS